MKRIKQYHFHKTQLFLVAILLLAVFMRVYRFDVRWWPFSDQSGFALVGHYAMSHFKLPLLGPFSSAGPFQTGGEWYWIIMVGYLLNYWWAFSPWLFITLISIGFVFGCYYLGTYFKDKTFGLIMAFLAAVSVGEVIQGTNLTNQTPLSWIGLVVLIFSIRYLRKKDRISIFFLGFFASLGMSIHLQGAALFILVAATVLFAGAPQWQNILWLLLGVGLPWVPVLIIDVQRGFWNTKNMLRYLFFNPNKIPYEALGRRWKTFVIDFLPHSWGRGVGGYSLIAAVSILSVFFYAVKRWIDKKLPKEILVFLISIFSMYVLLRYTRTPLFDSFFVFLHPLILFISTWSTYQLFKYKKAFGVVLLLILIMGSFTSSWKEIEGAASITDYVIKKESALLSKYPNKKFSIYDFEYKQSAQSLTLSLFLDTKSLIDEKGLKVGVIATTSAQLAGPTITGLPGDVRYIDLSRYTDTQLEKMNWVRTNPKDVYHATQEWYKGKDL